MTAIIYEIGGFTVTKAAILNGTLMPAFNPTNGANLTGVNYHSYRPSDPTNKTIDSNAGDTITLYIHSINANDTRQYGISGHGISTTANVVNGTSNTPLPFGKWSTLTVTVPTGGTFDYSCTVSCSDNHSKMKGSIVAGCG
jgi:plastocyanin